MKITLKQLIFTKLMKKYYKDNDQKIQIFDLTLYVTRLFKVLIYHYIFTIQLYHAYIITACSIDIN